ncbi:CHAT domain-containing protein [Spirillospora sp. CA-255316]
MLEQLWDAAAGPILDRLGYRRTPPGGEPWPRVWWVPVGPLALLPIHAAGYHRQEPGRHGRRTVMDRVVSSYTPTARALGHAREREAAASATDRMLIVAMPETPGARRLHHVEEEIRMLRGRFPEAALLLNGSAEFADVTEGAPTKAQVLERLGDFPSRISRATAAATAPTRHAACFTCATTGSTR